MAKTYTLHVAGLTRELPICKINDHLDIAAFIMFSDVELTIACAKALLEKCPDFDVILTAEAKGIPPVIRHIKGNLAVAHNGNLVNAPDLRKTFELNGGIFHGTSDTESIAYSIPPAE